MKIGVLTNFYPPTQRGGAELVAQRVADELARRGHKVFVLSTMPYAGVSSLRPHVVENHLERVYRFFPLNLFHLSRASSYPLPVRLLWHLIDLCGPIPHRIVDRLIDQEEPDVILTHNVKGLGVRAARCVQERHVRHIHTLHDVQLSVPSGLLLYGTEHEWIHTGFLRRWYEHMSKSRFGIRDLFGRPWHFLGDF